MFNFFAVPHADRMYMRAPVWVDYRNFLPFRYLLTIAAAFAKCREFFDSAPDLVLNCAAAVGEQDWERMYDVNIVSLFPFHLGILSTSVSISINKTLPYNIQTFTLPISNNFALFTFTPICN